jgi:hypothetical protein
VFPNDPVEDCAPFCQSSQRADLVSAHEAAVAIHICCEDCDEQTGFRIEPEESRLIQQATAIFDRNKDLIAKFFAIVESKVSILVGSRAPFI